jgi:hypothetical protein
MTTKEQIKELKAIGNSLNKKIYKLEVNDLYSDYREATWGDGIIELREKLISKYKELYGEVVKEEQGKSFPILFRLKSDLSESFPCLICGSCHIHGTGQGSRSAHCATPAHEYFDKLGIEIDGNSYSGGYGYVIVHVD